MDQPAPGMGHNEPPEPTALERVPALVANANRWATERPEIVNAEQAGIAQGFVDQLRALRSDLDADAKREREPFELGLTAVKIRYRDPTEMVGIAIGKTLALIGPWLEKEKHRIADEAAAKKKAAEEAEAKAAQARQDASAAGTVEAELAARRAEEEAERTAAATTKKPDRAGVKGDYSARRMTLTTTWHAEPTDESLALRSFAKNHVVRKAALEAATRVAGAMAREKKDAAAAPPGWRFYPKESPR